MRIPKLAGALAFCLITTISTNQAATIGSLVWNDLNRNGIQETNEPGLTNITLELYDCSTTNLVASIQSTNEGAFSFEGNFPSNAFLRVVLPTGYAVSTRDAGSDDALDSDFDPLTGSTPCFTINCTNAASTDCIQTNWGVGLYRPVDGVAGAGFWKTHPNAWPATNIVIAGTNYASSNAWNLFANGADKSLTLFRALLAARLNELAGNEISCITQELAEAEMWLNEFPRGSNVRGSSDAWKLAAPIAERLEEYNEGHLCAPAAKHIDVPKSRDEHGRGNSGNGDDKPGNGNGRPHKIARPQSSLFIIQHSTNMTDWVELTTVTNRTGLTDFFEDFDPDTNHVYRVAIVPRTGADPVNAFGSQSQTGHGGNTELLPIVYEGDLVVRGNNNDVSGAEDGGTIITGNLIISGNRNSVENLTVLGQVIIRGNRNSIEDVEHEGEVVHSGRGNSF